MSVAAGRSLTVGLVGCGNWGRHILRDLRALGCDVPVVARSDASRKRATDGGAARIVSRISDLGRMDGVVVASPTSLHAETLDELLPLGIPIYCEKPLTANVPDAERIVKAAPDRLFVMDKWRYHPAVLGLAQIARQGDLGRPLGIQTVRVQWGNPHPDNSNVIWHLMPHDLSIAMEILGSLPEPRHSRADVVNDTVVGMHAALGDDPWVSVHVSARVLPNRRETRLFCEHGVAWFGDSYDTDVLVLDNDAPVGTPEPRRIPVGNAMPLLEEVRAFVTHLRGGPPPRSSAADALASVRAVSRLHVLAGVPEAAGAGPA